MRHLLEKYSDSPSYKTNPSAVKKWPYKRGWCLLRDWPYKRGWYLLRDWPYKRGWSLLRDWPYKRGWSLLMDWPYKRQTTVEQRSFVAAMEGLSLNCQLLNITGTLISAMWEKKTLMYYLVNLTNTVIIVISTFWFSEYSNIDNNYHKGILHS